MQHITQDIILPRQSRGGRNGSSALRHSIVQAQEFEGLGESVNRYDLLLLVKRIGKQAGFTARMIHLLDYYMSFTRDCDWEQGSSPIIYQSLSRTALDMGISERQVQRLEQGLFSVGALTWHDSGNHRRYGHRDKKTGHILYAYGVDLTPLAYLKVELDKRLQEKRLYDEAWMDTKRQVSYYRGQIRAVMSEMELLSLEGQGDYMIDLTRLQNAYEPLTIQIRTYLSLQEVRTLLVSHKELHKQAVDLLELESVDNSLVIDKETNKMSSKNDIEVVHYNSTIKKQSNKLDTDRANAQSFQESSNEPLKSHNEPTQGEGCLEKIEDGDIDLSDPDIVILQTGLQHISLKQALNASSERLRDHISMESRAMNWNDFVDAAYKIKGDLFISQSSWARACSILGRTGAAICLVLTDQAAQRELKPVSKPGAYFNAMINRAKSGELHLHNSIFGILKKEYGDGNEEN